MKKFAVFLLSVLPAFAEGTVNQVSQQLGVSNTWALTMNWTGDSGNGSVPVTTAKLPPEIGFGQGYRILSAETAPGGVAPTNGYNVALYDSLGLDLLGGTAANLSSVNPQIFTGNSFAPIYGAFSLAITGNSVGGGTGKVIIYISPVSAIVISPSSVPVPPFLQPATAAVPSPGSASLPVNTKLAQTVSNQDFELVPSQACSGSSHDDTPAFTTAMRYVALNGGTFKSLHGKCWLNSSYPGGVHNVNTDFASNVTMDLSGTVFDTTLSTATVAFGMNPTDSLTPGAGRVTSYNTLFATSHDQWASPSNDLAVGATQVVLATAANAANYHKGDAIYIQSGAVFSSTPFNAEVLVAGADGDPGTGIVTFRDPTLHAYTNDSMNPWGLVNVEAATVHNFHIRNATSAKGTSMFFAAMLQCVDCSVDDSSWDSVGGTFTLGQTANLTLTGNTIHTQFPAFNGSGIWQNSTGMTRTYLYNNKWICTQPSLNQLGSIIFSEGSADSRVIGGEVDGCGFAGEDFVGVRIEGVKVISGGGMNFQIGGIMGTGLVMQGNDVFQTGTGSTPFYFLGGDHAVITGNKLRSPNITAGTAAINWIGGCKGALFQSNTVEGGGLTFTSQDDHNCSFTGNIFNGQSSMGNGILVADNGMQTTPIVIANNYFSGFNVDVNIANYTNEHRPVLTPNAVNDTTPYAPAFIGQIVPGIFGNTVNNLQQFNAVLCGGTSSGTALTTGTEFLFDYGTLCINNGFQIGMIGNAKWDLVFGNSSNSNLTNMEYNSSNNTWSWNGILTMSSTGIINLVRTVKFTGGTQSGTGATGVTSTTCSSFQNGICIAP